MLYHALSDLNSHCSISSTLSLATDSQPEAHFWAAVEHNSETKLKVPCTTAC